MSRYLSYKYFLFVLLLLLSFGHVFAQQQNVRITGLITTPTEPAAYATVSLLTAKDSVQVTAVQSDAAGKFALSAKPGAYRLVIRSVGYETLFRQVIVESGSELVVVKGLVLQSASKSLSEVVVTSKKPALEITNEKQVFDISQSLVAKGGSAADALKQVPSLNVSPGGKVNLRNETPVILVDGKRSLLTLQQIPADQIQSVEIMTNPSAKYDANGTSGIVNLIMKKNKKTGISGSISEQVTSLPENTVNGELNARNDKFNLALYYTYHNHKNKGTGRTDRTDLQYGQRFLQGNDDETHGPFQSGRLVLDYFADKRNTFSINANLSGASFHTSATQNTYYLNNGLPDSSGIRKTSVNSRFTSWRFSIDHAHQFKRDGEKLVSGIYTQFYKGPDKGNYDESFYDADDSPLRLSTFQRYAYTIRAHTLNFQSDYTRPFNKNNRLEAGVKIDLHKDDNINTMEDFDQATSIYRLNRQASYHYGYNDNTYAAYTTFSGKAGSFSYLAGLRYELYDFKGGLPDSNQHFNYQSPGLYPSIFLTEKLAEGQELHLNYSRRVNRPEFDQISPHIDYTNPLNLTQGNTHLLSEYSNSLELSYNYNPAATQMVTTLYYRNTSNLITQYTSVFSGDTLISRYANAGHSNNYGAELTVKTPLSPAIDLTANINALERRINAGNLQSGLSNSGFTWFAKLNSEIRLLSNITCQLTGNYHAAEVIPQGRNLAYGSLDLAVSQSFLKTKSLSVTASISDLFDTQKDRTRISLPGILEQEVDYKPVTRIFQLNLTYRFGKKQS
jgi:outer membrane receptor protein involved in Fe transport